VSEIKLTGIFHYPIKSCGGAMVNVAELDEFGVKNDRRWMLVDADGNFLTQRELPRMALIQPTVVDDGLQISAPEMELLSVPLPSDQDAAREVTVWQSRCAALDAGAETASWLSDFLSVRCRLVVMHPSFQRQVSAEFVIDNDSVSFADGFPLLMTSTASLDALNARLETSVPMNRFRPNLQISGADAFAEDHWKVIRIGGVTFHSVKPCARCTITTVDQATSERGREPLATLATFRKTEDGRIVFGQNLIHEQKHGVIAVGDPVEILSTTAL